MLVARLQSPPRTYEQPPEAFSLRLEVINVLVARLQSPPRTYERPPEAFSLRNCY